MMTVTSLIAAHPSSSSSFVVPVRTFENIVQRCPKEKVIYESAWLLLR